MFFTRPAFRTTKIVLMRKFLPLIVTPMLAVSCFNDVGYEASYNLYATFDGLETVFSDLADGAAADTAAALPAFYFGPVAYYNSDSEGSMPPDETKGGWIISQSHYPVDILLSHIDSGNSGDGGDGGTSGVDWESKLTPYCVSDTTDASGGSKDIFLVYHQVDGAMPDHDMEFMQASMGTCSAIMCAINTTAEVAKYFSRDAQAGDYLNVKVTGYLNGNATGTVQYCLADYRSGSLDSLRTEWKTLDLSRLGSVQYVDFEIESNLSDDLKYFCMDNFGASIHVKQ